IVNAAFSSALEDLLVRLRPPGQKDFEARDGARRLAHAWFTDKAAKKQVLEILGRFDLDESAVEAEAIRRSSSDLELLDRMLTSLESRRNKALGCVAEYRASLAHQLRQSADRIIDGKGVLRLEDAASECTPAACPWRANGKLPPTAATRVRAPVPVRARVRNGRATTPTDMA